MEHKEYKRVVNDAETAVLFVHGIVGTPNHFKEYMPLVPESYSVYNLLLDGHGKGVKDFANTSMKIWENQVNNAVDELLTHHNNILIVAHSMGCLFAIEQAVKKREVNKLFLLAPPMNVRVKFTMVKNSLKMHFNIIKPNDFVASATKNCCGVNLSKNIFLYLGWVPRLLELFSKIRKTRPLLKGFDKDAMVYVSKNDELVSPKSAKWFINCKKTKIISLENSGHFYYSAEDINTVKEDFKLFVK